MSTAQTADDPTLWQRFVVHRAREDREHLIRRHTSLANQLARRFYAGRQVFEIEFEEFRQYALVGLIEAVDRYDPDRGASFATYASQRIRGAILNGIEKYCERQQQISARTRMRQERFETLLQEAAEVKQDAFEQLVDVAIGAAIGYMLEDSSLFQSEEESYDHNVYRSREVRDLARILENLLDTLSAQEQTVIRYHYFQHFRFDQIAEQLGLSKGRISQIHHSALRRLRDHYDQLQLLRTDY